MLAYTCVYSFYSQDTEYMDVVEQQTENLELHTNALQILLGELAHRCPAILSPCAKHPMPVQTVIQGSYPQHFSFPPLILCGLPLSGLKPMT